MSCLTSQQSEVEASTSAASNLIPKEQRLENLHFSDGIVSSLDELIRENNPEDRVSQASANSSHTVLGWVDWLGEKFASLLGLSTPKYAYIIEESQASLRTPDPSMCGDLDDANTLILTPDANPMLNRAPSFAIDDSRDRRASVERSRHPPTSSARRDWAALFTRPLFIIMMVTFVLLIFTGLIFITAFTACRRQRAHRKSAITTMAGYTSATSPRYDGNKENRRKRGLNTEPIKLPPSSWTPSGVIYQPSSAWTCCCPRGKPDSLYDYCRQESIRPNECCTSDSMIDRSSKDPVLPKDSNPVKTSNNLRRALIRAPVVPTEQKTSVWIEKQQQQMARLPQPLPPPPPPPQSSSSPQTQLPTSIGQFAASLSPGSSVEFSYPRRPLDNMSTPGASAGGCLTKVWHPDNISGPDESLEALATDGPSWAVYSGPSMDTEISEGGRDEQSECTELSSNPGRPPLPQKLPRNVFISGEKIQGSLNNGGRIPMHAFSNSLRKPPQMIEYQRQRGTGATSSGGEESRQGLGDMGDWTRRSGGTHSASSQSENSAKKIMLNSHVDRMSPDIGMPPLASGVARRPSTTLIALTNFRKAEDNQADLVTPYAQFQISPEPSMHNFN